MRFLIPHPLRLDDLFLGGPLDELEGEFTGKIAFAGSSLAPADATVDFNLQGDSWQWGENTPPNEFALRGKVAQSTVDIDTAFVNAGETQVNLVAEGNLDQLNGKLVVNNLPVALAQLVYPLPADVEGDLDLTTTFGGSLTNPKIAGQAAIANPQINDYALTGLKTDFTYRNALLAVNAEVTVDEQVRPISVQGKVPYAPAFVEVAPSTDRLSISAIVPNGNLEIINALTDDKVQWQSGQGELTLGVGGTLSQPKVMGKASFRDAVVSSTLLADDVTNLSGNVLFDLEQVTVQQFQAQIDDGRLFVDGQLPLISSGGSISALLTPGVTVGDLNDLFIQQPSPAQQPPATGALRVALEKLPIDYSELVSGIFNGQLLVTGAALTPTVTGNIEVDNGLVNATNVLQQVGSSSIGEIEVEEGTVAEAINAYRRDYLGVDPNALEVAESSGAFDGILEKVAIRDLTVLQQSPHHCCKTDLPRDGPRGAQRQRHPG